MTRHSFTFLLLLSLGCGCPLTSAVARTENAEAEIRAVLHNQVAAWNRGDIDGFMNGYARSSATEFVGGDTLTRGWQTVHDRYAKKYDSAAKMGKLTFSELRVTMFGADAAMVTGRWKLSRAKDQPHGRFTLLFRHRAEGWRIVHDHTSAAEN